jgi:hypothetical protein
VIAGHRVAAIGEMGWFAPDPKAALMPDAEFLARFEARTLPFAQWTHRAHVKVAFLYLRALPFGAALERTRAGIRAYNAANRVPEGPTSG